MEGCGIGECRAAPEFAAFHPGYGLTVLLPDEVFDAGLASLSRIERADALVDFGAQGAQFLDMRQQRPPDLLLILGGQALHFGDGLFQCLDHQTSISNRSTQNKGSRDVGDVRGSVSGSEREVLRGLLRLTRSTPHVTASCDDHESTDGI